jgi:acyl carrier protein
MNESKSLQESIRQAICEVLSQSGRSPKSLQPADELVGKIGLDSLDLAQVVVLLEQRLGVDPFRVRGQAIRTLDDLHQAYRRMLPSSD